MTKILIATSNEGKKREFIHYLTKLDLDIESLAKNQFSEPEEDGTTFADNALIKANYYYLKTGNIILADDSGICVDALGGRPGIYTARWGSHKDKFERIYNGIKDDANNNYEANFTCVLCYKTNEKTHIFFEGVTEGLIAKEPRGNQGFGFDAIFIPNGSNKTFAEMSIDEKLSFSPRGKALTKLVNYLNK